MAQKWGDTSCYVPSPKSGGHVPLSPRPWVAPTIMSTGEQEWRVMSSECCEEIEISLRRRQCRVVVLTLHLTEKSWHLMLSVTLKPRNWPIRQEWYDKSIAPLSHVARSSTKMGTVTKVFTARLAKRYDTIYLRELKSWRNGQLSLAHGTDTKN